MPYFPLHCHPIACPALGCFWLSVDEVDASLWCGDRAVLTPPPCWTWLACSLGSAGLCGVPGAAPGPAPGGRTLAAGVADSAFGPRRSFCLGCGVSSRQRRGLEGTGLRLPCSLGSIGAHCVSPQSCTLSEDDSVSLRSRAASCITDSASEDALSIRSEMIQRKGAGLWGQGPSGCRGLGNVAGISLGL